jgi:nanoRNase/pAp phosphatase (c-di-AMP/oligoRNAs hydrolase)
MSAAHSHGSPRSLAEETPEPAFLFPLADSTSGAHRDAGMADIPLGIKYQVQRLKKSVDAPCFSSAF